MKKSTNPTTPGQQKPGPQAATADGEIAVLATIAAMPEPDRIIGQRLHEIIKASASVLFAETLVRDAGVCKGRQGCLLLPGHGEIQDKVRDVRLPARGKARRG